MLPQSAQDKWRAPKDVGALEWRRRLLGELAQVSPCLWRSGENKRLVQRAGAAFEFPPLRAGLSRFTVTQGTLPNRKTAESERL